MVTKPNTDLASPPQIRLWEDDVMPDPYHRHFLETGQCMNCRLDLRHTMHAFNHWRKFHLRPPKTPKRARVASIADGYKVSHQHFYVCRGWMNGEMVWAEVGLTEFLMAKADGKNLPVAYTKEMKK